MKIIEIKISTLGRDERSYINEAINAEWLNGVDQQVLSGDYSAIDQKYYDHDKENIKNARYEADLIAERKVKGYLISKDPKPTVALAVSELLNCTQYDVVEIVLNGNNFEAVNDLSNQKIKGEFKIFNSVVRFIFDYEDSKTLDNMRHKYIAVHNNVLREDGFDKRWYLDLSSLSSDEHISALMDEWLEQNPMPEFTNLDDFSHAVEKAYWALKKDEAVTVLSGGEYPLYVPAYRWNIEQAIINRSSGTMLEAALQYVTNLTSELETA